MDRQQTDNEWIATGQQTDGQPDGQAENIVLPPHNVSIITHRTASLDICISGCVKSPAVILVSCIATVFRAAAIVPLQHNHRHSTSYLPCFQYPCLHSSRLDHNGLCKQ